MGSKGFFTDTTICIGCKACEVACKQWNQLPGDGFEFKAMSYDNTGALGASTWRHVAFIERPVPMPGQDAAADFSWLMMSDVCKHCKRAGCLEACPTGAIVRTEFDTVFVQPDVCNGCGYCVTACPTESIVYGDVDELRARAKRRVGELHSRGVTDAYLYGADAADQPGTEGLNGFFLLVDRPE